MNEVVTVLTANLGGFEPERPWPDQTAPPGVEVRMRRITDREFAPRPCAMTPRLQSRIVKCFGWDFVPETDWILWVDASRTLGTPETVAWMLSQRTPATDVVVFRHPERQTVKDEARFIEKRLARGDRYLEPRYAGESVAAQMAALGAELSGVKDLPLYATTVVLYRTHALVRRAWHRWWFHISRYHQVDQLAFPVVCCQFDLTLSVIDDNVFTTPHFPWVRA